MGDEEMPVLGQSLEISVASRSEIQAIASEMVQHYIEHLDVADLIQRVDVNPISIQAIDAIDDDRLSVELSRDCIDTGYFVPTKPLYREQNLDNLVGTREENFEQLMFHINNLRTMGYVPIAISKEPILLGCSHDVFEKEYEMTISFIKKGV